MNETVWTIYDGEQKRRVVIFRRQDDTFGFEEEHFSAYEFEMCWIPVSSRSCSFFDTLETALSEVHSRVDWLISKQSS